MGLANGLEPLALLANGRRRRSPRCSSKARQSALAVVGGAQGVELVLSLRREGVGDRAEQLLFRASPRPVDDSLDRRLTCRAQHALTNQPVLGRIQQRRTVGGVRHLLVHEHREPLLVRSPEWPQAEVSAHPRDVLAACRRPLPVVGEYAPFDAELAGDERHYGRRQGGGIGDQPAFNASARQQQGQRQPVVVTSRLADELEVLGHQRPALPQALLVVTVADWNRPASAPERAAPSERGLPSATSLALLSRPSVHCLPSCPRPAQQPQRVSRGKRPLP